MTYGLEVTSDDGATVIVDGTSQMFKVQATGTLSTTLGADSSGEETVTLTALGALSTTPAHLSFVADGNATSDAQIIGDASSRLTKYAAGTSGGTVNEDFVSNARSSASARP